LIVSLISNRAFSTAHPFFVIFFFSDNLKTAYYEIIIRDNISNSVPHIIQYC
jgi:hypothetical protein